MSNRNSIKRRADYLKDVDVLVQADDQYLLGLEGEMYAADRSTDTLLRIMCERNVGLRSLLYALLAGQMTIEDINGQQLNTPLELS